MIREAPPSCFPKRKVALGANEANREADGPWGSFRAAVSFRHWSEASLALVIPRVLDAVILKALDEVFDLVVALRIAARFAHIAVGDEVADVFEVVDAEEVLDVLLLAFGVGDEVLVVLARLLAVGNVRVPFAVRLFDSLAHQATIGLAAERVERDEHQKRRSKRARDHRKFFLVPGRLETTRAYV
jgi:hypothetical protein